MSDTTVGAIYAKQREASIRADERNRCVALCMQVADLMNHESTNSRRSEAQKRQAMANAAGANMCARLIEDGRDG